MESLSPRRRQRFLSDLQRAGRRAGRANLNLILQQHQQAAVMVTKKKLSPWSRIGLDINNAGFSKLHAKESKYEEDKKKYNLEPEKFKRFAEGS